MESEWICMKWYERWTIQTLRLSCAHSHSHTERTNKRTKENEYLLLVFYTELYIRSFLPLFRYSCMCEYRKKSSYFLNFRRRMNKVQNFEYTFQMWPFSYVQKCFNFAVIYFNLSQQQFFDSIASFVF